MKREKLVVRALPLPRKYQKPGVLSIEAVEYALRSHYTPNRYWITLGAIVLPAQDRTIFGASACAPEDEHLFDRLSASHRALGRARQVAFRVWAGIVIPGILPEMHDNTLFGKELDAVFLTPANFDLAKIQALAKPLFDVVARHAAMVAAATLQKHLNRHDPDFHWSFQ